MIKLEKIDDYWWATITIGASTKASSLCKSFKSRLQAESWAEGTISGYQLAIDWLTNARCSPVKFEKGLYND